jgi:hypothetical protein
MHDNGKPINQLTTHYILFHLLFMHSQSQPRLNHQVHNMVNDALQLCVRIVCKEALNITFRFDQRIKSFEDMNKCH